MNFKVGDRVCFKRDPAIQGVGTVSKLDSLGDPCVCWDNDGGLYSPIPYFGWAIFLAEEYYYTDFKDKIKDRIKCQKTI